MAKAPHDDDDGIKLQGPLRRTAPLLGAALLALVIGFFASELLGAYRAIVLEVKGDQMLVGWELRPPEWQPQIAAKAGDVLAKEIGAWGPEVVSVESSDKALVALYERYINTYEGKVVDIVQRQNPQAADVAVIKMKTGELLRLEVWAEHLTGLERGQTVRKQRHSWDPVIVKDQAPVDAVEFKAPEKPGADNSQKE